MRAALLALTLAVAIPATALPAADPIYSPPVFAESDRADRVRTLVPEIDGLFRAHAEAEHIPGMVYGILMDGRLIHAGAYGVARVEEAVPVKRETRFRIASMTKSFTAMAILKLRDAGRLRLDDPVEKHVPAFRRVKPPTADSPTVTIRHLLRMDSGLPQDDPWGDRKLAESVAELEALVSRGLQYANPPGTAYEYSNLGYALLGRVVSRASGRPYQEYITREILRPLGMTNTVWEFDRVPAGKFALGYRWENGRWSPEPVLHDGSFGSMGGLITTLDDFARYVAFHLDAWPPRDDRESGPVRRASVREMHQPASVVGVMLDPQEPYTTSPVARFNGYAYGLAISRDSRDIVRVRHSGGLPGYGSEYRFVPDRGFAVISFGNRTYAPMWAVNHKVLNLIMDRANPPQRQPSLSPWMAKRAPQLARILQAWPEAEIADALSPNVFEDRSLAEWRRLAGERLGRIGPVKEMGAVRPINQLRGRFRIEGERGGVDVFFTLTPEVVPRIQEIRLETP